MAWRLTVSHHQPYAAGSGARPTAAQPSSRRGGCKSLSRVQDFVTPWTVAHQTSLSFTISWHLLKFIPIESVCQTYKLAQQRKPLTKRKDNTLSLEDILWEKTFTTDKGLIYKIYRQLIQFHHNYTKKPTQLKNGQKIFRKEEK